MGVWKSRFPHRCALSDLNEGLSWRTLIVCQSIAGPVAKAIVAAKPQSRRLGIRYVQCRTFRNLLGKRHQPSEPGWVCPFSGRHWSYVPRCTCSRQDSFVCLIQPVTHWSTRHHLQSGRDTISARAQSCSLSLHLNCSSSSSSTSSNISSINGSNRS